MDALRNSFTAQLEDTSLLRPTRTNTSIISMSTAPFKVIGRGSAGTVFSIPGTEFALKKGPVRQSIWTDSQMTNTACKAVVQCKQLLETHFPGISVPRVPCVYEWVRVEDMDEWWQKNGPRFVNVEGGINDKKRGYVFRTQLIPSVPMSIRKALICAYFHKDEVERAVASPRNRHCLVRPYLGQRRPERELLNPLDSLENFPLYLGQLIEVGIDIKQYATEMAVTLAIVHWHARLDGMDIEFVIGSAARTAELPTVVSTWRSMEPFSVGARDMSRRALHLWILDFDKASPIDYVGDWGSCCRQMVTATTVNDPYFPNPVREGREERTLWKVFETAYLKAAAIIIEYDHKLNYTQRARSKTLPRKFIEAWKNRAQEQWVNEDAGFIKFE